MALARSHPVLSYYALVIVISWGAILVGVGPGGLFNSRANPAVLSQFIYVAALAGPSIAGVLMTGLVHGRAGLRELLTSVFRWRVGARWYLVALLTAPVLMTTIIFALSLTSSAYVPAIVTTDNRVGLLMSGILMGLVVSFFEELGWTGFATPELRKRFGFLPTGAILGLIWGAWHYPLFSGSDPGTIPSAPYIAVLLFSFLVPCRILMVWVYDRIRSVIVVMLMHAPLAAGQTILLPAAIAGERAVVFDLIFGAALWVIVAVVWLAKPHIRRGLPLRDAPRPSP